MATTYPALLPCPQTLASSAAERRWRSDPSRPREAAAMQRDRHTFEQVAFPPFNTEQAAAFRAWWRDDLIYGAAWFSATWPSPRGSIAQVRRFVGAPRWDFISGAQAGYWRISAVCEVRGAGSLAEPVGDPCWNEVLLLYPFDEPVGTSVADAIDYGPGSLPISGIGTPTGTMVHETTDDYEFDGRPAMRVHQAAADDLVSFFIDARGELYTITYEDDLTFEWYAKRISGSSHTESPLWLRAYYTYSNGDLYSYTQFANYAVPNQLKVRAANLDWYPDAGAGAYAYGAGWVHMAVDMPASEGWASPRTATLYIDGVPQVTFNGGNPPNPGGGLYFNLMSVDDYGADTTQTWDIRLSNLRITKCRRYSAPFTPEYMQFPRF